MDELETLFEETRARTLETLKFSKNEEERELELHRKYITIDSLNSGGVMPYSERMVQRAEEMIEEGRPSRETRDEIGRMRGVETVGDPKTRKEYVEIWRSTGLP